MNYDELLRLLKDYAGAAGLRMDRNSWLILADVVELHKPYKTPENIELCSLCLSYPNESYPCETIQTIRKELA